MAPVFASTKHPRGWYPIHLAVLSGNIGLVKTILEKHVSGANVTDTFNDTKSTEAVNERREEFGECSVGTGTYNVTPLHYACYMGNWDIIKLLIDNGAGFEEKDSYSRMPFEYFNLREVKKEILQSYSEEFDKWKGRRIALSSASGR